jgi:hypothetical protein
MGKIDPGKERARLAARYAAMTELELQKVGRDPMALAEWARDALHEEMSKRGLQWKAEVPRDEQAEAAGSDLPVVLRRYRDMPAAFIEKSVLENAGIECFLQDDNVVRMDWLWSNAMGGIKLVVRARDVEDAEQILSQSPAAEQSGGEAS